MARQYYERALELASAITLIGKMKNSPTGRLANLRTTVRDFVDFVEGAGTQEQAITARQLNHGASHAI
jgi:hypothetical protein